MRHNKWNKCLKIACSWILIFSMCFLSLNTVNASAEDTNAFESESEETKQETEKQIPDSIEVEQLNTEIQKMIRMFQLQKQILLNRIKKSLIK